MKQLLTAILLFCSLAFAQTPTLIGAPSSNQPVSISVRTLTPVIIVGALVLSFAGLLGYARAGDRHERRR